MLETGSFSDNVTRVIIIKNFSGRNHMWSFMTLLHREDIRLWFLELKLCRVNMTSTFRRIWKHLKELMELILTEFYFGQELLAVAVHYTINTPYKIII